MIINNIIPNKKKPDMPARPSEEPVLNYLQHTHSHLIMCIVKKKKRTSWIINFCDG